jgi:hypothetical protein
MTVYLRDIRPEDEAFVYNSWLKSYKKWTLSHINDTTYYKGQHNLIQLLLATTNIKLLISEETESIVGYICWHNNTLHYLYVKDTYRGFNFGSTMVASCIPDVNQYSHRTFAITKILPNCIYNPFALPWLELQ